jgi:hypothetical protein
MTYILQLFWAERWHLFHNFLVFLGAISLFFTVVLLIASLCYMLYHGFTDERR